MFVVPHFNQINENYSFFMDHKIYKKVSYDP